MKIDFKYSPILSEIIKNISDTLPIKKYISDIYDSEIINSIYATVFSLIFGLISMWDFPNQIFM